MQGIVGQMQREEGARKVKRGLMGVIEDGRNAGGKAYGYSPVLGKPGELEIVPSEHRLLEKAVLKLLTPRPHRPATADWLALEPTALSHCNRTIY